MTDSASISEQFAWRSHASPGCAFSFPGPGSCSLGGGTCRADARAHRVSSTLGGAECLCWEISRKGITCRPTRAPESLGACPLEQHAVTLLGRALRNGGLCCISFSTFHDPYFTALSGKPCVDKAHPPWVWGTLLILPLLFSRAFPSSRIENRE